MKRNIRQIVLPCLLLLTSGFISLNAQDSVRLSPRYALSAEPMYLFNGGLRLNFEYRLSEKKWLEWNLTPYYLRPDNIYEENLLAGTSNSDFNSFSKLLGIGAGAGYKYYFASLFFISPNVSYTLYRVDNPGYEYKAFTDDGLVYYQYERTHQIQVFNKFTGCLNIGGRTPFRRLFFLEYYVGMGVAYSLYDTSKRWYNDTMFGYGYRGLYLTTGLKLGFNIR